MRAGQLAQATAVAQVEVEDRWRVEGVVSRCRASPTTADGLRWPCFSSQVAVSVAIFPNTLGPRRIAAVQTWTAAAPAMSISMTSVPRETPPQPMTGMSTTDAASWMQRIASGLRAGPDSQP